VECKANYAPLFKSWIERDHIPRFQMGAVNYKVILTNGKRWYSRECKRLLGEHGILLLNLRGLIRLIRSIGRRVTNTVGNSVIGVNYTKGYTGVGRVCGVVLCVKCVKKEDKASCQGKIERGKAPLPTTLRCLKDTLDEDAREHNLSAPNILFPH